MKNKKIIFLVAIVLLVIFIIIVDVFVFISYTHQKTKTDSCEIGGECLSESGVHIHADFKMFINGSELNLYVPTNFERNNCTHFHEGLENVIHVHCADITIGDFLKSLDAMNYITGRNVLVVVNEHSAYFDTVIKDLDKVLITDAGDYSEVEYQYSTIRNLAREASDG